MTRSSRIWILLPVFLLVAWIALICLAMPGFAVAAGPVQEHPVDQVSAINPGSDLWREVRQRDAPAEGTTQVHGVDSGVLINYYGDLWARLRINEVVTYGGALLIAALAAVLLFYLVRGRIRVKGGFSGNLVRRFNRFQIVSHWLLAGSFIFLGLTGLILLFGRELLIPLLGREVFSGLAGISKDSHNLVGLLFIASLLLMLVALVKKNLYEKGDLEWMLTAAGTIGKKHPSIGFFNLGEKSLFWSIILIGLVISVSGLVLVTPNFGQGRVVMEASHLVHVSSALVLLALSFIHMYLGLYGVEGALDGMTSGYVDINWADAHHDRWARQCRERGEIIPAAESGTQGGVQQTPGTQSPSGA